MTYGLVLLHYGNVGLPVSLGAFLSAAAHVNEELGLVKIFLVSGEDVEFCKGHLGYLVAGNPYLLAFTGAYLAADAVGIGDGYVKEVALSGCPVVGDCAFYHMA